MLPPALGGLRFRVPPVPGRHAPGSMVKIKLSCGHPQDDEIILHSPFRRQIAKLKIKAEMKIHENEITVRTKSRIPHAIGEPRGGFAPRIELAFGDSASLRGIRGQG